MVSLVVDIAPKVLYSAHVELPFGEGKELLEKRGYRIISLQENAQLRIQQGPAHDVSIVGNWVSLAVIYDKRKGIFLAKKSPIMANAQEATTFNAMGRRFYLTEQQIEESLEDSVEISGEPILTTRFAENPETVYAFGSVAEQYGRFLKDNRIRRILFQLAELEDRPFAMQLWFEGLNSRRFRSALNGNRYLGAGQDWVRGVIEVSEATVRGPEVTKVTANNHEAYTVTQIERALVDIGAIRPGLRDDLLRRLRQ